MRITVDRDRCEGHGQCSIAAPELFELDDQGVVQYDESPAQDLLQLAEDAMDACPVQAITVEP